MRKLLLVISLFLIMADTTIWGSLTKPISQLGYNLRLEGYGISEPKGTPYDPNRTPGNVYTQNAFGVTQPSQQSIVPGSESAGKQIYGNQYNPNAKPPQSNVNTNTGGGGAAGSNSRGEKLIGYNANGDPIYSGGGVDNGQPSAPAFDQAAYDAQLNNAYDPAFRQADDVEAMYRAEYPTSQEFINNSYAEALTPIQNTLNTQLQGLDTQAAKGKQEEKNQIATARQKYNELRTGGLTRFGGASSTGEAYSELLGRATSQEMAGVGQNFGQMQMDIEKERANVNTFFAERKSNLEKEKQNKLQELKNSFDDEIRKINSTRTALESEKAGKRMSAIQEFSVQARQVQYEAQVFAQKLDAWKAAKDEAVQLATSFGAKSFSIPSMPGVMGGFSVTGQNQPTGGNNLTPDQIAAANAAGYVNLGGKWVKDYSFGGSEDDDELDIGTPPLI